MTTITETAQREPMALKDWAQLLVLGAIWGGSFFFARIAVAEIHPLVLVFFRVSIAALVLHIYLALRGPSFRIAFTHTGLFFALALTNNVIPFSLIFAGQTELGAGLAAILNATTPFWTLIIANFLTDDEKLSPGKIAGIALGIGGTVVMIGPGLSSGLSGPVWAKFALIGATISYAVALMIARRFKGVPSPVVATGQFTVSTVMMIPVVLVVHGPSGLFSASPPVWAAVLALAILSTAFAYILYFNLVASAGATNASLVTLVVPVSAILLGVAFLGEHLEAFEIVGMTIIALGLVTIDGRLFHKK